MFNKKYSTSIFLALILFLATFIRFYKLSEFPVGFHGDEASLAYNAYSILLTGRDENRDFLPIHSYISRTYRPIGYTYLTIPSVLLFGLNEFSARFAGALFGILTVGAVYFLSLSLFNKKSTALVTALLLAVNPWHVGLSRASAESLAALFFVVVGFICVIKLIQDKHRPILFSVFAILSFVASFATYPAPRVFVPTLLFVLIPLVFFYHRKKIKIILFLGIATFCMSAFFILGTKGGLVKFNDVGILSYELPKALLLEDIREDGTVFTPPLISRVFHNKVTAYGRFFIKEYMQYFSFNSLVGGEILPMRYRIHEIGLIYIVDMAFLLLGIYSVFRYRAFGLVFALCWIIIGPFASALTWEDTPNVLRSLPLVVGLILLSAYGATHIPKQLIKNKSYRTFLYAGIVLVYGYCILTYFHQYYVHGLRHRPWYRDYGFKELIQFTESKPEYKKVYVTKATAGPYIHFLFYLKFDPKIYQQTNSVRDDDYKGFGKYIFVPDECPDPAEYRKRGILDNTANDNILFIANGTCNTPLSVNELKVIVRPDDTPVFRVWEAKNNTQ